MFNVLCDYVSPEINGLQGAVSSDMEEEVYCC